MISYVGYKHADRAIRKAVLDDVTPAERGTDIEYWQGETDFDPVGPRKTVFEAANDLYERGFLMLYQVPIGDMKYSYRARVVR